MPAPDSWAFRRLLVEIAAQNVSTALRVTAPVRVRIDLGGDRGLSCVCSRTVMTHCESFALCPLCPPSRSLRRRRDGHPSLWPRPASGPG